MEILRIRFYHTGLNSSTLSKESVTYKVLGWYKILQRLPGEKKTNNFLSLELNSVTYFFLVSELGKKGEEGRGSLYYILIFCLRVLV